MNGHRKIPRISGFVAAAAGLALIGMGDVAYGSSTPSPSPSSSASALTPVAATPAAAGTCTPQIPNGTSLLSSDAFRGAYWNESTVTYNWYITLNGNYTEIAIASNTACWQEYHDAANYNQCLTDGGLGRIYNKTCTGVPSQLWNSGGDFLEYGENYGYWVQNQYVNDNYKCSNGYPYLVGALASSGPKAMLTMDCQGTYIPSTEIWIYSVLG